MVEGEGMPLGYPGEIVIENQEAPQPETERPRGNLVLRFNIKFPRKILAQNKQRLVELLEGCQDWNVFLSFFKQNQFLKFLFKQ